MMTLLFAELASIVCFAGSIWLLSIDKPFWWVFIIVGILVSVTNYKSGDKK